MLQILFQYTQWKVALTVTIQRVSENQHRSGILSSDYSFGDEEMWTSASLVVIRSECWNRSIAWNISVRRRCFWHR